MIPVTQETKTALHQAVKQVKAQITWATSADTTETITSEDRLISMKKEAEGYYCKSTLRKITVVLTGTDINLLDRKITALVQVKTGANTWGDISWGSFTITEAQVDEAKGTSTFTGYGGIAMLQSKEYNTGELSFPTTVGGLLKQVAEKFALTIDPGIRADGEPTIPNEYQEVQYLENANGAYILTGLTANQGYTFRYTMQDMVDRANGVEYAGSRDGTNGRFYAGGRSNNGVRFAFGYGSNLYQFDDSVAIPETGKIYEIETKLLDTEQSMAVNGAILGTYTGSAYHNDIEIAIYGYKEPNILTGTGSGLRIYKFKIINASGTTVRDYVPCRRKSDSVLGFYDRANGSFTTAETGNFVAGADITTVLPNGGAPIEEDLWEKINGTTYRDILEEIAGATGTIAVIGRGDDILNLELPPVSGASETLTEDNLITAKIGENWGKVSAVVFSRQPQGDNVEVVDQATVDGAGGKNLQIIDRDTYTTNGITFTLDTDGGVIINGTTTANAYFDLNRGIHRLIPVPGQSYTLSVTEPLPEALRVIVRKASENIVYARCDSAAASSTFSVDNSDEAFTFVAVYGEGVTVNNLKIHIQLEKGSEATPYEQFVPNGRVDLVIANNEILDKQRETTATPILEAVKGWDYRNAEIKTEGHGYHEIGDRLDLTVAGGTYPVVVTKSSITIDGGIKEVLTSATPEVIPIDYAKSGGITKTVFRTELTVDKQAQQIDSIVSRQDATDAAVAEQFTQITQNLTEIVATAQASGGGNFIRNSVGFGKESDGTLTIWTYGSGATTTTVKSQSAPASLSAGAVSGHEIQMTGASAISQQVSLTPGETYTLALRAKKNTTGAVTVKVANTSNSATVTLASGTSYNWQLQKVEFVPVASTNTVTITVPSGASVEITDLILTSGGAYTWRQASGEIYNAQVSLDQAGVQVRSSVYTGDYVEITPLEFSGWSNASGTMKKVFTLNRETTEVEQLEARSQLKMAPIKIVPINNSSYKGWAFVKEA